MICTHLRGLEQALAAAGIRETHRGQVWTDNCREWVHFDVVLDIPEIQRRFSLAPCVEVHENTGPRPGLERGLCCRDCLDGVLGRIQVPGAINRALRVAAEETPNKENR